MAWEGKNGINRTTARRTNTEVVRVFIARIPPPGSRANANHARFPTPRSRRELQQETCREEGGRDEPGPLLHRPERQAERALHVADQQVAVPTTEPESGGPGIVTIDRPLQQPLRIVDPLLAVDPELVGELEGHLVVDAVPPELDLIDPAAELLQLRVARRRLLLGNLLPFQLREPLSEVAQAVVEVGGPTEHAEDRHHLARRRRQRR